MNVFSTLIYPHKILCNPNLKCAVRAAARASVKLEAPFRILRLARPDTRDAETESRNGWGKQQLMW